MSTIPKYRVSNEKHIVRIEDPTTNELVEMMNFIENANLSFVSTEDIDVSDITIQYDILQTYIFAKEEDALIFALKFKGETRRG